MIIVTLSIRMWKVIHIAVGEIILIIRTGYVVDKNRMSTNTKSRIDKIASTYKYNVHVSILFIIQPWYPN